MVIGWACCTGRAGVIASPPCPRFNSDMPELTRQKIRPPSAGCLIRFVGDPVSEKCCDANEIILWEP